MNQTFIQKRREIIQMNSKEFKKALELLEERGMDREYIYEGVKYDNSGRKHEK